MTDHHFRGGRLKTLGLIAWIVLAVATFVLAVVGWTHQGGVSSLSGLRLYDYAAYKAFKAFGLDGEYAAASLNDNLRIARWSGFLVVTVTVILAGWALFRAQVAAFRAFIISRHTLIIGDHEMAFALVTEAVRRKLPVVHISAGAAEPRAVGSLITLPRGAADDPIQLGRAARARRVVVAETDLGASIEQGLHALGSFGQPTGSPARVAVHLDDSITAERIHHAPGGANLFAFSEAQAVARAVMLRHPPFLMARGIGAAAVHILIVGFGRLGQALARDLVLNSLVSDLGRPYITVIDPNPEASKKEFLHKHPEFTETCQFEVLADLNDAPWITAVVADAPPVCVAYVCIRDSAVALSTAITLRERSSRHDQIKGPIFVRLRSGGPLRPHAGVKALKARQIYSFGGLADAAASCHALDDNPDRDAQAVHEAYARIGGFAVDGWDALPEEMRVSNRRVISHIPAKLASLGFDLEDWLALPDQERPWPPSLKAGEDFFRDDKDRLAAAILEHDRWMADRRVNGWRYGAVRDNDHKVQNHLVAFADLPDAVKAFDAGILDWVAEYVTQTPGVVKR